MGIGNRRLENGLLGGQGRVYSYKFPLGGGTVRDNLRNVGGYRQDSERGGTLSNLGSGNGSRTKTPWVTG